MSKLGGTMLSKGLLIIALLFFVVPCGGCSWVASHPADSAKIAEDLEDAAEIVVKDTI